MNKLEKTEKTEKKKYYTEFQEEKNGNGNGNTSADNYLKNLGITLLPKKFSNRNIFPKNERFASIDSFEKEKFKNDYFNRKNRSDNERDLSDKNVNDSNDYDNNINTSCDDNNNNYNNNNNNSSSNNINNSSLNNNNIDNNNSSSTRNSYKRSKYEEKPTSYENQNFNHLAIEKEEKQANNISAVNLIPKNKIDAQAIILLEIKRLSFSLKKLEKDKIKLELKVKFKINKFILLFC